MRSKRFVYLIVTAAFLPFTGAAQAKILDSYGLWFKPLDVKRLDSVPILSMTSGYGEGTRGVSEGRTSYYALWATAQRPNLDFQAQIEPMLRYDGSGGRPASSYTIEFRLEAATLNPAPGMAVIDGGEAKVYNDGASALTAVEVDKFFKHDDSSWKNFGKVNWMFAGRRAITIKEFRDGSNDTEKYFTGKGSWLSPSFHIRFANGETGVVLFKFVLEKVTANVDKP